MVNHRAAADLLMIVSLLVAVAISRTDARPTVGPNKEAAALRGANVEGLTDVHPDAHDGPGYVTVAAAPAPDSDSDLTDSKCHDGKDKPYRQPKKNETAESEAVHPPPTATEKELEEPKQELCSTCEPEPKPEPPPCDTCEPKPEPEPEMTCNKVHAVKDGETCYSMGQCAGLEQDDFLRFNPNICCDHLFVGQWVCLEATCGA